MKRRLDLFTNFPHLIAASLKEELEKEASEEELVCEVCGVLHANVGYNLCDKCHLEVTEREEFNEEIKDMEEKSKMIVQEYLLSDEFPIDI